MFSVATRSAAGIFCALLLTVFFSTTQEAEAQTCVGVQNLSHVTVTLKINWCCGNSNTYVLPPNTAAMICPNLPCDCSCLISSIVVNGVLYDDTYDPAPPPGITSVKWGCLFVDIQ